MCNQFPLPEPCRGYRPSWGNYSEAAKKAAATRNHKRHLKNKETFRTEILPIIEARLDPESLLSAGLDFDRPDLLKRSGFRKWVLGERHSWIFPGDPKEEKAREMGATVEEIES